MIRIHSAITDSTNYLADKIIKIAKRGADKTDRMAYGFTEPYLIHKRRKGLTDTDDVLNTLEVLIEHDWLRWKLVESTDQGGILTEH